MTVLATVPANAVVRPGQFVRVRIITAEHKDCFAVPEEGVVTTPQGQTVIAIVKDDQAFRTPAQRGVTEGGWVEVKGEGLAPGMTAGTVGAYGLPDATKIRVMGQ
ncbi:MAG: hypothetical protein QHH07_01035 [Sedimentisphaerales bacterium]|nr:hypothetical protein [Sedimentisphaerales bacterium]